MVLVSTNYQICRKTLRRRIPLPRSAQWALQHRQRTPPRAPDARGGVAPPQAQSCVAAAEPSFLRCDDHHVRLCRQADASFLRRKFTGIISGAGWSKLWRGIKKQKRGQARIIHIIGMALMNAPTRRPRIRVDGVPLHIVKRDHNREP